MTCYGHLYTTFLILLLYLNRVGPSSPELGLPTESEDQLTMETDMEDDSQGVDYRYTQTDVWGFQMDAAFNEGLSPLDEFYDSYSKAVGQLVRLVVIVGECVHSLFRLLVDLDRNKRVHHLGLDLIRDKKHNKQRRGPKIWDQWGKWSPCSVTCGVGKIVRWRHCVAGGCAQGEKEAQIKSCTLPAC